MLMVSWRWMRAMSRCFCRFSQVRRKATRCMSSRRRWSMGNSADAMKRNQRRSKADKPTAAGAGLEPAGRRGTGTTAPQPLSEERDAVDLEGPEEVPVDATGAWVGRARRDYLARGDEEVGGKIVRQHGDPLGGHLERVH